MVFFPSYKFMEDVLEVYENEFSSRNGFAVFRRHQE